VSGPSIGFIGLGEAGFHIAKGLKEAGLESVTAYDLNANTPRFAERIQRHSTEGRVPLVDSSEALAGTSDVILSTVAADAALDAAEQIAPFLAERHLYADLNSVSPDTKQTIDSIVTGTRARFVEVTIMSPVSPKGHRAPMLLAGPSASELLELMSPYGMQMELISDRIGAAASVKLCRSIIVKGLEALMIECAMAAQHYGVDERVFSSLNQSFPGTDWGKLAEYMTSRVALHGERRAREMDEVVGMLNAIGIEPIMAAAAARRHDWCAGLGLAAVFGGEPPQDYRAIVEAIRKLTEGNRGNRDRLISSSATEDSNNG
jgi:3-hydroxyisobutyrate dehydrogenase-like beta-hydroxyacid dehydrogenase